MNRSSLPRRSFLRNGVQLGAGLLTIAPSGVVRARAGQSPNGRLNVALIGVGGRGRANAKEMKGENVVAICDVDAERLAAAAKEFPGAKTHEDWRRCLDQKDIEAVVCSTTDHTHAFVNLWAMNRGKHVYCEKPLANSVEEARLVREAYLRHRGKLATQMGTQIHACDNYRRVVELIRSGAIGTPQEVRVWCSRMPEGGGFLPGEPVPAGLNWDLWIGPSRMHPYNPGYVGGCLKWNRFWDFGSGQIGDMGSHMIDLAFWAFDLKLPASCKAQGSPINDATLPQWLVAEWEHPANDWRPPVKLFWYDGGKKPGMPSKIFASAETDPEATGSPRGQEGKDPLFKGLLFKGDKGVILADYGLRVLLPGGESDMTHYKTPRPEDLIPVSPGHHQEWLLGCKEGKPTLCNFDYSGMLIENNLLALVAYRAGKKLEWDAARLRAANAPEADAFIRKSYREGWTLNG